MIRLLAQFIFAISIWNLSSAGAQADAILSGELHTKYCSPNNHDLIIRDSVLGRDETLHCTAAQNRKISVQNTHIFEGSHLTISSLRHRPAWGRVDCFSPGNFITGTPDCNRCANNVAQQFDSLFVSPDKDTISWDRGPGGRVHRPHRLRSRELNGDTFFNHVQGFVRTNRSDHPYVGTFSVKRENKSGLIFGINDNRNLVWLEKTHDHHPSGASLLGRRVWFADRINNGFHFLRAIDTDFLQPANSNFIIFERDQFLGPTNTNVESEVGGGVGLAELNGGGFLLVTMGPGGNETDFVKTHFFYLERLPSAFSDVSSDEVTAIPLGWWSRASGDASSEANSRIFNQSENITLITECETGKIFVINTTGEKKLDGKGRVRLSRIEWQEIPLVNRTKKGRDASFGPALLPMRAITIEQDNARCHPRSAATFWVNEAHQIEMYCSEFKPIAGERHVHFQRWTSKN